MMPRFFSLVLILSSSAWAAPAKFQSPKPGEWELNLKESGMLALQKDTKQKVCIEKGSTVETWREDLAKKLKESHMDCKFDEQKQTATELTYQVDCKATAEQKSEALKDSRTTGEIVFVRESDTTYLIKQKTKSEGVKIPNMDLSKVPPEQRAMLEAMSGKLSSGLNMNMSYTYTYVGATCSPEAKKL